MIITKTVHGKVLLTKGLLDIFIPKTVPSTNWKHWKATLDLKTCEECSSHHGQIYAVREIPNPAPPLHPYCRCVIEPMRAAEAGGCSREGENGADWWLWKGKGLPNYYIFIGDLKKLGWKKEILLLSMHLEKWLTVEYTIIEMVTCLLHLDVFGVKQI